MATDIELNAKIDTANAAQSINELKKSLKELVSAQGQVGDSASFAKLSKAINDTEGKIGDLNDSFNTLKGSGVERLNGSLGLLRESFTSGDPGKFGIALKGVGAALGAIPIFAVIEGLKYLYENFDKVSAAVKGFFNISTSAERQAALLNKELKTQQEITKTLSSELERQIKVLEAQGASENKILAVKKQLTAQKVKELEADIAVRANTLQQIILNDTTYEQGEKLLSQYYRKTGNNIAADAIDKKIAADKKVRLDEENKAIAESINTIKNLKNDLVVEEIKVDKKSADSFKKTNDDKIKESQRLADELFAQESKNEDARVASINEQKVKDKKEQEDRNKELDELKQLRVKQDEEEVAAVIANEEKKRAEAKATEEARFGFAKDSVTSLQGLSDFAFAIKSANTKKGTAEEEKAARAQFNINKGLQIANAGISGVQGILQAATAPSGVPIPFDIPFRVAKAVGIGLTTAATIAKIAGTQFASTSAPSGGASAIGSGTSGGGAIGGGASQVPNATIQGQNFNRNTINQVGQVGGGQNISVSVTEINRVNKRVSVTESQSTFG